MKRKAKRPDRASISRKCATLASLNGVTQAELAKRVGIQASNLNHFLRGHADVRASLLLDILAELGLDVEDMINNEIARIHGIHVADRPNLGHTFESVVTALDRDDRRTLVRYVSRMAQVNLGTRAEPHLKSLKKWVDQKA